MFKPLAVRRRWRRGAVVTMLLVSAAMASSRAQNTAPAAAVTSAFFDAPRLIADLRELSSDAMAGRATGTEGNAKARAHLLARLRAVGVQPVGAELERPFGRGVNVVGLVPGRQTPASRYIVVSAHYDHIGARDGEIFNGANDNASGVAALPAIASYFLANQIQSSLLIVAFDAEEPGMLGSRAFVREPPVPRERVLVNVNADMIGRDRDQVLYVSGTVRFPVLRPFVERVAAAAGIRTLAAHDGGRTGVDWTTDSDQFSFMEAGIPALYVGVEDERYHHRPDDEFESMMPTFYVRAVETIIALVRELDAGADQIAAARRR